MGYTTKMRSSRMACRCAPRIVLFDQAILLVERCGDSLGCIVKLVEFVAVRIFTMPSERTASLVWHGGTTNSYLATLRTLVVSHFFLIGSRKYTNMRCLCIAVLSSWLGCAAVVAATAIVDDSTNPMISTTTTTKTRTLHR
jgi:hypothetical protein